MKKQWMFAILMIFFGWMASQAQSSVSQSNINYGLGGGIGMSHVVWEGIGASLDDLGVLSNDPIVAYGVHGYIGIRPSHRFGLSFEPGYSRRGGKVGLLPEVVPVDATWKMDYIQLPALLDFYVTDRISVSAGPELAWRVNSNAEYLGVVSASLDQKFSAGILAGIQVAIHDNVEVGVRYHRALTPAASIDLPGIGAWIKPKLSLKNQYVQVMARYRL